MVIMASGISRGRVRTTTESHNMAAITKSDAKLFFVSFLWLGPIDFTKRFQRTNVQKEELRARINTARSSQEDRERIHERRRQWY